MAHWLLSDVPFFRAKAPEAASGLALTVFADKRTLFQQ